MEQRLAELASVLGATENFLVNAVPGEVWVPATASAADEMRRIEARISTADIGWSATVTMLMAMLDHMKTIGTLLRPNNYAIFGGHVLTRSCLEAAARLI